MSSGDFRGRVHLGLVNATRKVSLQLRDPCLTLLDEIIALRVHRSGSVVQESYIIPNLPV